MKYFSTFSGIGGFEIGIERAALSVWHGATKNTDTDAPQQGMEPASEGLLANRNLSDSELGGDSGQVSCVGFSEIDKYASSVYEYNFPGVKNYGDITKINEKELPDFDCLVGGFPCQAFSIAGKRGGFADTRGTLFFDLARILKEKQPRLFVFENVKGLLSHDEGRTFRTIIATIDELGYDCQWQVLNSKNHGVPQNRERIYIVGHLRGTPRPEVFSFSGTHGEVAKPKRGDKIAIPVLTPDRIVKRQNGRRFKTDGEPAFTVNTQDKHGVVVGTLRTHKDGNGFREVKSGVAPTLPARARQDGSGQPVIRISEATAQGYAEATIGQAINPSVPNSKTRRGRVSDIAPTLDTGMQLHTLTEDVRIRRLTPKECERLQGFPDDWTRYGFVKPYSNYLLKMGENMFNHSDYVREISDTQRYKMCGNAVTTNVVQAVFERIFSPEGWS